MARHGAERDGDLNPKIRIRKVQAVLERTLTVRHFAVSSRECGMAAASRRRSRRADPPTRSQSRDGSATVRGVTKKVAAASRRRPRRAYPPMRSQSRGGSATVRGVTIKCVRQGTRQSSRQRFPPEAYRKGQGPTGTRSGMRLERRCRAYPRPSLGYGCHRSGREWDP